MAILAAQAQGAKKVGAPFCALVFSIVVVQCFLPTAFQSYLPAMLLLNRPLLPAFKARPSKCNEEASNQPSPKAEDDHAVLLTADCVLHCHAHSTAPWELRTAVDAAVL